MFIWCDGVLYQADMSISWLPSSLEIASVLVPEKKLLKRRRKEEKKERRE